MKINKGRYTLCSDEYSYWITEKSIAESGKEYEKRIAGYCTTLDKLIRDFSERVVRSNDAEDLEAVLTALKTAQDDCEALLKGVVERDG